MKYSKKKFISSVYFLNLYNKKIEKFFYKNILEIFFKIFILKTVNKKN